ncbi:MAG: mycofactocin precursor MftA [Acidimicrobiaceae bacterium]|nr:mycofactocin precursor MftA [Acidimicrobiaceae bacterium]
MKPINTPAPAEAETESNVHSELVEEELLVEEISIDGMCGVY